MTKEELCKSCRWLIINASNSYIPKCRKHVWKEENIWSGPALYSTCVLTRMDTPFCQEWEQGGIKGFFQRMFKKGQNSDSCTSCNHLPSLDEAIAHCYEVATKCGKNACGREHLQLASWLEELKKYRENQ